MGGRTGKKVVAAATSNRHPGIAEYIFAEVEQLTAERGMKRTAAFAQVAERTRTNPGTVAANYYRIARKLGVALRPRQPRGTSGKRRGTISAGLAAALRALEIALRSQAEELDALRKDNERFEELRRLLRQ